MSIPVSTHKFLFQLFCRANVRCLFFLFFFSFPNRRHVHTCTPNFREKVRFFYWGSKIKNIIKYRQLYRLFEDFTVGDFFLFTVDDNWFIPGQHVVDEFNIFIVFSVQFFEIIGFPIWSNIKGRNMILTSD